MRIENQKIRIVCFGDSLTWGYDPDTRERFPENVRWTGVLQERLGEGFTVIEEGQNARTIATEDPAEGEKNGSRYIIPCMESHSPFDILIIMLGTNDTKEKFGYCSMDIAGEMQLLLEKVKAQIHFRMDDGVKILLMAPPYIGEKIDQSWLGELFGGEKSRKKSMELADRYKQLAQTYDVCFLDTAAYVHTSDSDSIHMDAENQIRLGEVIAEKIREMIDTSGR